MPWQRLVADVGGELVEDDETGLMVPAYRNVVFSTPRQSGKTTLVLGWECQRAIGWEHRGPQRIAYSAQTGNDARKKLIEDQKPILDRHKKPLGIRRFYEASGNEGIVWLNGSRLVLLANTEAAGHGKTVNLGIRDELFSDFDDRREQALRPSMVTIADAQTLSCSTMGTDESIPWNALVERGRLAVQASKRTGTAYFEWSADPDDDLDDPATWWSFMPALGYTITESTIAADRDELADKPSEFRRAYGNLKTAADERILPAANWAQVCSDTAAPVSPLTMSLDVNPERSAGAIVAASPGVAELIDHRPGIGWLVPWAVERDERLGRPTWVVDSTGPAASLIAEMEKAHLSVHPAAANEVIKACGQFFDGVMEGTFALRRHRALDEAAAAVAKRQVGDAFAWVRRSATRDICPVMAATLALWGTGLEQESVYESRGLLTL